MSTSTPTTTSPTLPHLRILLLHGYTQTPTLFRHKTSALTKHLSRSLPSHTLAFTYVCGPHKLSPADNPAFTPATPAEEEAPEAYGWWRRKDIHHNDSENGGGGGNGKVEIVYEGLEEGLGAVAKAIREEGPFDGVVGFSQGAACAGMLASLLEGRGRKEAFEKAAEEEEEGRMGYPSSFLSSEDDDDKGVDGFVQGPLKFAVCYSGFRAPGKRYAAFYEPRIQTPILHVLGQLDVVVDEVRARALVSACEGGEGRVVVHPGGHFVPSQKPWLDAVVGFVRGCVEGKEGKGEKEDVRAEDMDVPF